MSTAYTFYFENIIPDYDTWQGIMEQESFIDYTDATQSAFDNFVYKLVSRRYTHCNIRYSTPEPFICELVNVYQNKFAQFLKEKNIIDEMYQLTNEELVLLNNTLSNVANNPNDAPTDPLQPLQYISAQTYTQANDNKLRAYFNALNSIPNLNTYKFLRSSDDYELSFDDLFMQVQPNLKSVFRRN